MHLIFDKITLLITNMSEINRLIEISEFLKVISTKLLHLLTIQLRDVHEKSFYFFIIIIDATDYIEPLLFARQ